MSLEVIQQGVGITPAWRASAILIMNQEPGLTDEVVMVIGERLRSRKSHRGADVAECVITMAGCAPLRRRASLSRLGRDEV